MKRRTFSAALCTTALAGCAPAYMGGPSVEHGFNAVGTGLANLILSPLMIAAGLLEGLVSIPYFVAMGLHDLNRGLVDAQARVNLGDTYRHAYGRDFDSVPASGDTGVVFTEMRSATTFFRNMMRSFGERQADNYVLTAIRTADAQGFTLYAVMHRPARVIDVVDKLDPTQVRRYGPQQLEYYQPFEHDAGGRPLDRMIDWAGVPRTNIRTQKAQAILINIAANSILGGKHTPDYWSIERRWIAGQFYQIAAQRDKELRERMGLAVSPFYSPSLAAG